MTADDLRAAFEALAVRLDDVERLQRINATLKLLPPDALAHTMLRPIETLVE